MNRLIPMLFLLVFFGCKNQKEDVSKTKNKKTEEIDKVLKSEFIVDLEVIVLEDDVFEMFYKDYDNHKYSWKTKIQKKVKGGHSPQIIRFKLPKLIFPKSLRFDFGNKPDSIMTKLVSMKMTYEDFNLNIMPKEFSAFFVPNKYIEYNKQTGEIITTQIKEEYDPYFDSKPVFKKRLEIEAR